MHKHHTSALFTACPLTCAPAVCRANRHHAHPRQERLAVSDEEFAKWKFAFCTKHLPPESLGDEDTISQVFIRAKSELKVDTDVFLGMQV